MGVGVLMQEIDIENIKHSNELMMCYTGLPVLNTFQVLFKSLIEQGTENLCTKYVGEMNTDKLGR